MDQLRKNPHGAGAKGGNPHWDGSAPPPPPPINPVSNSRAEIEKQFGEQEAVRKHRKKCRRLMIPTPYVNGANGPRAAEGVDLFVEGRDACASDSPLDWDETITRNA